MEKYKNIEKYKKRMTFLCALTIVMLLLIMTVIFAIPHTTFAKNRNVKIQLAKDSKFAAYNEGFVYTHDNTLFLVQNDIIITQENAYLETCKNIAMTDKYIAVLSSVNKFYLFQYEKTAITKIENPFEGFEYLSDSDFLTVQNIFTNNEGELFYQDGSQINKIDFEKKELEMQFSAKKDIFNFVSAAIFGNTLFAIGEKGELYSIAQKTQIKDENLANFLLLDDRQYSAVGFSGDRLYANSSDGVFLIDRVAKKAIKQIDSPSPNGKIQGVSIDTNDYLLIICPSDLSIKMYLSLKHSLTYINSFDDTEYQHPKTFDIISAIRLPVDTSAFVSPKNLLVAFSIKSNEVVLQLAEQDNYFYVTDGKGNFGYIHKATVFATIPSQTETPFGAVAQALHQNTKIYKYPFDTDEADVLDTIDIYKKLEVVRDVATENSKSVWGWVEIRYINADKVLTTGYVKYNEISPHTELQSPVLKKDAKIKTNKFGEVAKVYVLQNTDSKVLSTLADGSKITLVKKYDPTSEWTAIQFNDGVGYIKTSYIQVNGLTNVQIITIISVCALAVVTAVVITIIALRRRKNFR